jgi:hypothetical protein
MERHFHIPTYRNGQAPRDCISEVLRSSAKVYDGRNSTEAGFSLNAKGLVQPAVRTSLSRPEVYYIPYWGHPFLTSSTFVRIQYELHAWISWVRIKLGNDNDCAVHRLLSARLLSESTLIKV